MKEKPRKRTEEAHYNYCDVSFIFPTLGCKKHPR